MLKFIILAPGRSGSTMLESVLQQHENVTCNDELLTESGYNVPLWDIDQAVSGFKCLYPHIHPSYAGNRGRLFWLELQNDPSIRIIHVRRGDELARAVSVLVTNSARKWHCLQGETFTPPRAFLKPENVIREVMANREREAFLRDKLRSHPWFETTYETLCTVFQPTVVAAFSFLEVFPETFAPKFDVFRRVPLSEYVENFAEVCQVLRETGLASLVDFNRDEPWRTTPVAPKPAEQTE